MTHTEARAIFTAAIASATDAGELDQAAELEICRAYFTDSQARQDIADAVWAARK